MLGVAGVGYVLTSPATPHPPASPTEFERAQQLADLWRNHDKLMKQVDDRRTRVEKANAEVVSEEDELGKVVKDLEGRRVRLKLTKRRLSGGRGGRKTMKVVRSTREDNGGCMVGEADSAEEVGGFRWKRRKVAGRGWFGGGAVSAGRIDDGRVIQQLNSLSEEDRRRVHSVATRVEPTFEDPVETPCS